MKAKKCNKGFSIIEVIVVIAIMAVLVGVLAPSVIRYVDEAKEAKALTEAKAIYTTAQCAIINAAMDEPEAFHYALKFKCNVDGQDMVMGRFSNQSLYKYLQESGGSSSLSSAKSKAVDYYIAEQLAGSIPGADGEIVGSMLQNKSPIGDSNSTKFISENSDNYGNVVFGLAYNSNCEILYFQCVYNGYFITMQGRDLVAQKVSEDTRFNSWPLSSDRMEGAVGW